MMEADDPSTTEASKKQAACLECRKSKIRCIRPQPHASCRKCEKLGTSCIVPDYHVGRYKGVKNKRTGLEKAISQVEKAIKKSRDGSRAIGNEQARALEQLLRQTGDATNAREDISDSVHDRGSGSLRDSPRETPNSAPALPDESLGVNVDDAQEVTVDNADNPLQLLAIASAIPGKSSSPFTQLATHTASDNHGHPISQRITGLKFFQPIRSKLDVSPELDPIDLGLVTEQEATRLFDYFYAYLAHTRWGMDPALHTYAFVRSRSAFLLSSVMAASALFLPDTAALSVRLRNHICKLVPTIISQKYRSVEIILAFMINIPWMIPGEEWNAEDDTCYYLSLALTIALDISLHRIIVPTLATRPHEFFDRTAKADCIDASKVMAIDGFENLDPSTEVGQRVLRTRERTWLALFNLDRGVCLARGRPPTVPTSALVQYCDTWHISESAEAQDGALTAVTILRRDFATLVASIRTTCDSNRLSIGEDSAPIRSMRDKIEIFFDKWYDTWRTQLRQADGEVFPYVDILASHTKLSAYCGVINHPTAPEDVKKFFRAAGLASALTVLKVAAFAESRLRSMPNNTVIMVSFAALFVLGLGNEKGVDNSLLAPNTQDLIEEVARVLERLGSTPPHRKGASFWFGKHLQAIVQSIAGPRLPHLLQQRRPTRLRNNINASVPAFQPPSVQDQTFIDTFETGTFENNIENFTIPDMTNDQLIDVIDHFPDNIGVPGSDIFNDETELLNWFQI